MELIIPSARVVSQEMQKIGKLPAILYPVNKGIVLDYMIKQYASNVNNLNIVAYESAERIERRLRNYQSNNIRIVKLDSLQDLGYTIYSGLINCKNVVDSESEVIINFADTIVMDNIYDIAGDCYFYYEDYMSDTWTFFDEEQGKIKCIIDKKQISKYTNDILKLFVGVFKISYPLDFIKCLEVGFTKNSNIDSFYIALLEYSKLHPMTAVKTDNWFDIGHAEKYYNSKLAVRAREFNHITVDRERGILRKTSVEKEKFSGEILWYLKLPADIEYVRPRIFSYSTNYNDLYVEMEYYSYHTVHELFLYGDLTYNHWIDIFNRIKFICKDFSRYKLSDGNIREALEEIYLTKTIQRLMSLKEDKKFTAFFHNCFSVNGIRYKSLNEICEILKKLIPEELYDVNEFNIIHGDLCFSNIMVDSNFSLIKVIDPRGKFGKYDIYGDTRYEMAKLFHSIDGKYDFIIKDLFTASINEDPQKLSIDFTITDRQREFDLYECFLSCFKDEIGSSKKKIELIEALLFLSMIPLHKESVNHQIVMLATGISILDRCANIRD